jgi:SAM-dependent methyltransferase/uncharacterized protein YbaR (Trm112 family)
MRPRWGELGPILRCPATGSELTDSGDGWLVSADGAHRYPLVDGVPILIAEEKSLFDIADIAGDRTPGSGSAGAGRSPRERLASAAMALARRFVPHNSRNIGAGERLRRMAQLVREQGSDGGGRRPRVLAVGGQVVGAGAAEVVDQPDIVAVETDVGVGPRTIVACDAHDLPFADGSFDGVLCQAVLDIVIDPYRCAEEVHRVLAPGGVLYSELPFMQQVKGGAYDFTRFTELGHRRLWRKFDAIGSGAQNGPGMALAWSLQYFAQAFATRPATVNLVKRLMQVITAPLTLVDGFLVKRPGGRDAAAGTWFLGRRRADAIPDREIVKSYSGLARWGLKAEADSGGLQPVGGAQLSPAEPAEE